MSRPKKKREWKLLFDEIHANAGFQMCEIEKLKV